MSDFLLGSSNTPSTNGATGLESGEVRCGGRVVGQGGKRLVIGSTAPTIETRDTTSGNQGLTSFSTMNVPSSELPSCSNGVQQFNFATQQSYAQTQLPPAWIPPSNGALAPQEVPTSDDPLTAASYIDIGQLFANQVFLTSEPHLSLSDSTVDGQTKSTLETETYYLQVPPAQQNGGQDYLLPTQHNQGQSYAQQQMQHQQQFPIQNGDMKPYQGFVQNSTILNDDQNSFSNSSSMHSSSPSPKPQLTIPPNQNYPGTHNFRIHLISAPLFKEKKTPPWTFSEILNRLFCKVETSTPIGFKCDTAPPQGARVQCMAIFSSPAHIQEGVTRCPHHLQNDVSAHKAHFIRAEHDDARYGLDPAFSRESVTIPHEKPQAGMAVNEYILKFMCLNTCQGGINRRETQVVFTLLSPLGEPLGRAVIDLRVCASPGRDRKKEEAKLEKELEKESLHKTEESGDAVSNGAVEGNRTKSSKRKMETATVTTHVTTVSFDQEASVAVPKTKRSKIETSPLESEELSRDRGEETGEVFTITTRYKEDYEILLKMKEGLEFGRMATAEKRDAVKQKVLSEVSHDPSNPARHCPPPSVANDVSGACLPITNGIAGTESSKVDVISSVKPTVGKQRQSSARRVPDPDSTTTAEKGERDRNLYDAAAAEELEDAMDCIGVEERSTQPFTGIKEPSSLGSSETDIMRGCPYGLTDIFDDDDNLLVFDDGLSNKKTSSSKKQDDNNNNDKSSDKSIAKWLESFGMVAYTDLFKGVGVSIVKDLEHFDKSCLDKLKLSQAHSQTIWREVNRANEKQRSSTSSSKKHYSSTASHSPEELVIPSLEKMALRGMSRFKKDGSPKDEGKCQAAEIEDDVTPKFEDESSNMSEASEKTSINLASHLPLTQKPSSQLLFFSQPSELPSSKIESVSPVSASQPVTSPVRDDPRPTASSHSGIPSRSLGSLSQFLRDQVGSFGLSSSNGTLNSSAGDLATKMRSGGVLKVRKYTFKHSFSLTKD